MLACTAFLQGLASEDLAPAELERHDPYFPLLIAVRAVKAGSAAAAPREPAIAGRLDEATCAAVSGWAYDPAAPFRRLKLDVWDGEQRIGAAWSRPPPRGPRARRQGRRPRRLPLRARAPLHGDPPPRLRVMPAGGGEPLPGSPRAPRCACEQIAAAPGLRGAALDMPRAGQPLPFPWLEFAGWAVGEDGPVEAVELCHRGEPFRRVAARRAPARRRAGPPRTARGPSAPASPRA